MTWSPNPRQLDRTAAAFRRRGRGMQALAAVVLALLGAALAGGSLASGANGGSTTTTTPTCPASNPPNELVLAGGSPQTAKLDTAFGAPFQVTVANSNGCPVTTGLAGTVVTVTAPASGASGTVAASGSNALTVGADGSGDASASGFAANDVAGTYTIVATSDVGAVDFTLTNTSAGIATTITPVNPTRLAADVDAGYTEPLQAHVVAANGNPVEGASVTFPLGSSDAGAAGGGGADAAAGASFVGGSSVADAVTDSSGVATSPVFTANDVPGPFAATAQTAGVAGVASFPLVERRLRGPGRDPDRRWPPTGGRQRAVREGARGQGDGRRRQEAPRGRDRRVHARPGRRERGRGGAPGRPQRRSSAARARRPSRPVSPASRPRHRWSPTASPGRIRRPPRFRARSRPRSPSTTSPPRFRRFASSGRPTRGRPSATATRVRSRSSCATPPELPCRARA